MTQVGSFTPLPAKGRVLGVDVSVVDMRQLLAVLDNAVQEQRVLTVSFVNPNYLMRAREDSVLRQRMNAFDVMLADGWGIVAAARVLGARLPERLSNDDIGPGVFGLSEQRRWRTFLFGSAPGVAERAAGTLRREFPQLPVVGTMHGWWDAQRGHPGWFDDADNDAIIEAINTARSDVLWVGLPTPLQQQWVADNAHRLNVRIIITGGSYLDHIAERLRWYPRWVDTLRVGWLYRLSRDPRRLWRRYSLELLTYGGVLGAELTGRFAARLARSTR